MVAELPTVSISGNGREIYLTETTGWSLLPGVEGFDGPPVILDEDSPAAWDGGLVRAVRYAARDVFLPLAFWADTADDVAARLKYLALLTDPKQGRTTITVASRNGSVRTISGFLSGQLGNALEVAEGRRWRRLGLTFRCPDPFWLAEQRSLEFGVGTTTEFLGDDFLPLTLGDSQVLGTVTIDEDGGGETYPIWTITGPATAVTIRRVTPTPAVELTVPAGLTSGQTLTIDTTRGTQSVVNEAGANAWARLGPASVLWALQPGANTVNLTLTGTSSPTSVRVLWRTRHLTAW